ncbi:MAG: hypothetical protein PWR03_1414 [Tenuifilum sp.]|jgi:hypothetical protein|uniref:DUF4252 domain-containing protein n=1 Tax=Tenuifilum sp. TaxID=2760880 RepID=UPI0024AB204C|nr:DUF4252 domain-containing protein [Tenuifilum sp.]MDI3527231.1 hypothetical protein [Tenuifilum sp.]
MKNVFLFLFLSVFGIQGFSQSIAEKIVDKYSGEKGFAVVKIGPELFSLAASFDDDGESDELTAKLKGLLILVSEQPGSVLKKEIETCKEEYGYKQFMEVQDDDGSKVTFLAKLEHDLYGDLIIYAQSPEEELFMSILGKFTRDEIIRMGNSGDSHLSILRKLENK